MEICTCANCQNEYESMTRLSLTATESKLVSVDPCPKCGLKEVSKSREKNVSN